MKKYNDLDFILEQQSEEEKIKELIEELQNMSLDDFKFSDYTYIDDFNTNDIFVSFYYDYHCYGYVKLEDKPDDPSDLWDDDIYDKELIELKEMAIKQLKEEL